MYQFSKCQEDTKSFQLNVYQFLHFTNKANDKNQKNSSTLILNPSAGLPATFSQNDSELL